MRHLLSVIFIISVPFYVTACDSSKSNPPSSGQGLADDNPRIEELSLACGAPCAPQVGALYNAYNPQGPGVCTASLVGETDNASIVATAKHCVAGIDAQSGCSQLFVDFPEQDGFSRVSGRCAKILDESPDDVTTKDFTTLDYAFVLLDRKISRPQLQMVASKVEDNEDLTVHYMDTTQPGYLTIRTATCQSAMNSMVNTSFKNDHSRILTLWGCDLTHGASGSPVVDTSGGVVALLFEGADRQQAGIEDLFLSGFSRQLADALVKTNFALRVGCIDAPSVGLSVDDPQNCQAPKKLMSGDDVINPQVMKNLTDQLTAKILAWNQTDTQKIFSFDLDSTQKPHVQLQPGQQLLMTAVAKPKCFNRNSNWLDHYKSSSWFGKSYEKSATVTYDLPVFYGYLESDDHFRAHFGVEMITKTTQVQFSPADISTKGSSAVTINSPSDGSFLSLLGLGESTLQIQLCPPDKQPGT